MPARAIFFHLNRQRTAMVRVRDGHDRDAHPLSQRNTGRERRIHRGKRKALVRIGQKRRGSTFAGRDACRAVDLSRPHLSDIIAEP